MAGVCARCSPRVRSVRPLRHQISRPARAVKDTADVRLKYGGETHVTTGSSLGQQQLAFARAAAPKKEEKEAPPPPETMSPSLAQIAIAAGVFGVGFVAAKLMGGSKPAAAPAAAVSSSAKKVLEVSSAPKSIIDHIADRTSKVHAQFPGSMAADDFLSRIELYLAAQGFRGENSLALTNVCRDESTAILKTKIDDIYGQAFNINGLGAVLTCGVTGIKAGLSHAPIDPAGKERYIFFAFPHVAVDENGKVAAIHRPGRQGESGACGALMFALSSMKSKGVEEMKKGGSCGCHDHMEPEASILCAKLAAQIEKEELDVKDLDVPSFTKLAERTIKADLEYLISKAVDTTKADYAVVTGIQIHSWPSPESGAPALEFVMPGSSYLVIGGGEPQNIEMAALPALTPRQVAMLASRTPSEGAGAYLSGSTLVEVDQPDPAAKTASALNVKAKDASASTAHVVPEWAAQFSS